MVFETYKLSASADSRSGDERPRTVRLARVVRSREGWRLSVVMRGSDSKFTFERGYEVHEKE